MEEEYVVSGIVFDIVIDEKFNNTTFSNLILAIKDLYHLLSSFNSQNCDCTGSIKLNIELNNIEEYQKIRVICDQDNEEDIKLIIE